MRKLFSIIPLIFVLIFCLVATGGCSDAAKTAGQAGGSTSVQASTQSENSNATTAAIPGTTPAASGEASASASTEASSEFTTETSPDNPAKGTELYVNSRYGFSISYPSGWAAQEESPSGDGTVLYQSDSNDIRVYGGYIIDDSIDRLLQGYNDKNYVVSDLITDQGEKGKLVEGSTQGRILFHFILLGRETQCQLYALVTQKFYDANGPALMKAARQLALGEGAVMPDKGSSSTVDSYRTFLDTLLPRHIGNVKLAEDAFRNLVSGDKASNDELFRLFRKFYTAVANENQSYFLDGGKEVSEAVLKKFGMRISGSESGDFISEDPGYLYSGFSQDLTDGLKEFLSIRKKHFDRYPATNLIEDAGLSITWDELSDWVIDWERYAAKNPGYPEAAEAKGEMGFFLGLYLLDYQLDNTPMFVDGVLSTDLQHSYLRFIDFYPDSQYCSIVKGYYEILKKNGFKLTKEAVSFLSDNGVRFETDDIEEQ